MIRRGWIAPVSLAILVLAAGTACNALLGNSDRDVAAAGSPSDAGADEPSDFMPCPTAPVSTTVTDIDAFSPAYAVAYPAVSDEPADASYSSVLVGITNKEPVCPKEQAGFYANLNALVFPISTHAAAGTLLSGVKATVATYDSNCMGGPNTVFLNVELCSVSASSYTGTFTVVDAMRPTGLTGTFDAPLCDFDFEAGPSCTP